MYPVKKIMLNRFVFLMMVLSHQLLSQQNNTLFFMHSVPQSNFLNPAIQNECKLFIGLPVISSIHVNIANSGFTLGQLLEKQANDSFRIDADFVAKKLAPRNFLSTEIHTTVLAVGLRRDPYYYTFTINEKNNAILFYPRDMVLFGLEGNTQFEGQWLSFNGTGLLFNHYREFALGISKNIDRYKTVGIRAKLLFGKLNIETSRMNVRMFTEQNTFDLLFDINARANASFPYSIETDGYNYNPVLRYDAPVIKYIFNRRNPGIAFDAGFIYKYTDDITLSGSILDLGFIYYGSNLTNYSLRGEYLYTGPLGDTIFSESYLRDLFNSVNATMDEKLTYNSYLHFLSPTLLLGATLRKSPRLSFNALIFNKFYKMKYQNGITLSALSKPLKNMETSLSWSYMNRSVLNLGFGFAYGKTPVQFYLVSDNILAPLVPMHVKNINLRFGFNIHLGCYKKEKIDECGCSWIQRALEKEEMKSKIRKKM